MADRWPERWPTEEGGGEPTGIGPGDIVRIAARGEYWEAYGEAVRAAKALPGYYRRKVVRAVREVGRGARPERVELQWVVGWASLAVAVGALAAYIEGLVRGVELPVVGAIARLLAEAYSALYFPLYFNMVLVLHALAATVLLSVTKVVRGYAYRRTVVDMLFWTVFAAAVAAVNRAAWLPFLVGFAAWGLFAVAVALAPVLAVLLILAALVLLLLVGLAYYAGKEAGTPVDVLVSGASKLLLAVVGGPVLALIGGPIQFFAVAKMVDRAWESSDVPLAFLVALFSLVQWLAPPLVATVLAGVWLFFGTVAAATGEWKWLRIPLAATVVHAMNLTGNNYDVAASAAVEAARWLGAVTGSEGVRRAADLYAWLISVAGARMVPAP
jgi:hypothetical protein